MGDGLEDRYKDKTTNTQPENDVALGLGKLADLVDYEILRLVKLALQRILQDEGGHQHRYQRRDENLGNHSLGGNHTLDPKHDGRHVADR